MKFEIKHRYSGEIIFSIETETWRLAVEAAIKSNANLRYANLSYADLSSANLRSADLSSANLRSADLSSANLRYANLSSANLSSANLSYANLSYANLSFADLRSANLSFADLSSADLSYANLSFADLSFADLMQFQFQQHPAYYTFNGALRIGCLIMPVNEWALGFKEIGEKHNYTKDQIEMYGKFISMCLEHFKRTNP